MGNTHIDNFRQMLREANISFEEFPKTENGVQYYNIVPDKDDQNLISTEIRFDYNGFLLGIYSNY